MNAEGSPMNRASIEVSYKITYHFQTFYSYYREEDKWTGAKSSLIELLTWLLKNTPVLWADTDQNPQCTTKREHLMIWAQLDNNSTTPDSELTSLDTTELLPAMWLIWAQSQLQSTTIQWCTMDHQLCTMDRHRSWEKSTEKELQFTALNMENCLSTSSPLKLTKLKIDPEISKPWDTNTTTSKSNTN